MFQTDAQARVCFSSVLPEAYPIPTDGPVGRMLKAMARDPMRPPHMHFMIEAPGYERLVTHVFRDNDQHLDTDAVFGVQSSLITHWQRHDTKTMPDGQRAVHLYYTLDFKFVLNPGTIDAATLAAR